MSRTRQLDLGAVRRAFDRAAPKYDEHAVLQREVGQRLLSRLAYFDIRPQTVLDLGAGTGEHTQALLKQFGKSRMIALDLAPGMLDLARRRRHFLRRPTVVCADAQRLPLADASVDLVFSSLAIQWCDRLDQTFAEVQRVLRPGGVFLFSTFGPDTLKELRASWAETDAGEHVHPFVDMHDIGDLLLHAGMAEPVMDREEWTLTYADIRSLMRDLKHIGAHNALQGRERGLTGRGRFERLQLQYEQWRRDGQLPATYEIVYGTAWRGEPKMTGEVRIPIDRIGR